MSISSEWRGFRNSGPITIKIANQVYANVLEPILKPDWPTFTESKMGKGSTWSAIVTLDQAVDIAETLDNESLEQTRATGKSRIAAGRIYRQLRERGDYRMRRDRSS